MKNQFGYHIPKLGHDNETEPWKVDATGPAYGEPDVTQFTCRWCGRPMFEVGSPEGAKRLMACDGWLWNSKEKKDVPCPNNWNYAGTRQAWVPSPVDQIAMQQLCFITDDNRPFSHLPTARKLP